MGTTKWKALALEAPLLFLKKPIFRENVVKGSGMDSKKNAVSIFEDESFHSNLDAHLELTLRSDAELIIERKIEEEVDDDLSLIFK